MPRLGKSRQTEIDCAIEDLLQKTGATDGDVVKLLELCKELGVEVKYAPLLETVKGVSGVIKYGEKPIIYIKESLGKERGRFTLAHEIGHYVLHKKEGVYLRVDNLDYSKEDSIQETEANYFAGVLLLPKRLLLRAIEKGFDNKQIAKIFGVSEKVVEVRRRWLLTN